jgi:hypothetical protein
MELNIKGFLYHIQWLVVEFKYIQWLVFCWRSQFKWALQGSYMEL